MVDQVRRVRPYAADLICVIDTAAHPPHLILDATDGLFLVVLSIP
jgi:hypothetical protein